MINVKNLKKTYRLGGEVIRALDNVSLEIMEGEMVAIVGPSGSGKSTLMHVVGGLDRVESGEIRVNGRDISLLNSSELANYRNKEIGFIFQTFNLQAQLTALENVELPMIFSNVKPSIRKRIATEALEKVGLKDRLKHKPGELSGGQRQRVSIARSIVNNPSIILADEPTGNLDSKSGDTILKLLKDINHDNKVTILVVTHDEDIASSCSRIIKFKDGKIV